MQGTQLYLLAGRNVFQYGEYCVKCKKTIFCQNFRNVKTADQDKAYMRTLAPMSKPPSGTRSFMKWDLREGTGPTLLGFLSSFAFPLPLPSLPGFSPFSLFSFYSCSFSFLPLFATDDELYDQFENFGKKSSFCILHSTLHTEIHFDQSSLYCTYKFMTS